VELHNRSLNDMSHDDTSDKPLSEAVLLILTSLASGAQHGYLLLKNIERLSDSRVRLSTGTLYGALRRLLEADWIVMVDQADQSRDKQAYKLTAEGRRRLAAEHARLKHLVRLAGAQLRRREA
jgi:DNA-binding PadR family transcriptional regulator